jgi:hypothetical protein
MSYLLGELGEEEMASDERKIDIRRRDERMVGSPETRGQELWTPGAVESVAALADAVSSGRRQRGPPPPR